jgi:hypothetical protein
VLSNAKRLVALVLRGVANRLDPEPPHQQEALKLLGWHWNETQWVDVGFPVQTFTNVITNARGEG